MTTEFATAVSVPDDEIDLAWAALLFARDTYPEIDPGAYVRQLDTWAGSIRGAVESRPSDPPFGMVTDLLFDRLGFRGNESDYTDPRNSYLNQVIDRRRGLPIALSVIYLEIGWRVGLPLSGVGLPGHFIVRCDSGARTWFIDPFHQGDVLDEADCARLMRRTAGDLPFSRSLLLPVTRRQILARMLHNLRATYVQRDMLREAQPVIERLIELDPASGQPVRDLGLIHFRQGAYRRAIDLLEAYLGLAPDTDDVASIRQVIGAARAEMARQN